MPGGLPGRLCLVWTSRTSCGAKKRPLRNGSFLWGLMGCVLISWPVGASGPGLASTHWAVQPLGRPEVPGRGGGKGGLDRFLQEQLESAGLTFSARADRRTWLRRVSLDLVGIPPTTEALDRFERDDRPDAEARQVEALLADPAYGERWGRWWLDVARYADTNGQDENKVMANAWRYRDWVVRALNADLPYDRFVMEQVAGDLMPADGLGERERFDRWIATGFLVLGPKLLAEQDKPKLVMDIIDEQIDTLGRAFLGLTLGCARCHDHKFDPVSQREYYALAGIFRGTRTMENLAFVSKFHERRVATMEELESVRRHEERAAELEGSWERVVREADASLASAWSRAFVEVVKDGATRFPPPVQARVARFLSEARLPGRLRAELEAEGAAALERWRAILAAPGLAPGKRGGAFRGTGTNRLEFTDQALGVAPSRGWTLATWVLREADGSKGESRRWLLSRAANEWTEGHLALVLDGDRPGAYANPQGGRERVCAAWGKPGSVPPGRWIHLAARFDGDRVDVFVQGVRVAQAELRAGPGTFAGPWVVGMRPDGHVGFRGLLDEVRVFGRGLSDAEIASFSAGDAQDPRPPGDAVLQEDFDPVDPDGWRVLEERTAAEALWGAGGVLVPDADLRVRRAWYDPAWRERVSRLEADRARHRAAAPPAPAFALAVAEGASTNLPVFLRGNHLAPSGPPVPRGFPAWMGEIPVHVPGEGSGRLELARWLVHPDNPLTARVLVNRVWLAHFGEGLVRTPENFGRTGEPPTHPELLDWLAVRFREEGWSLKWLHRVMVLSEAYAQSSVETVEGLRVDPENRLWHRYPRQRLDAETLRDSLLAVAGTLDRTMGGSLVDWKNDEYVPAGDAPFRIPRRTLYLPVVRDRGTDLCIAFDGANPSVPVPQRSRTVVTPQALYLLNAPLVLGAAQEVARRVQDGPGEVENLYRAILGRRPSPSEREQAGRWMRDGRLSGLDEATRRVVFAQALLASNEFTHRE